MGAGAWKYHNMTGYTSVGCRIVRSSGPPKLSARNHVAASSARAMKPRLFHPHQPLGGLLFEDAFRTGMCITLRRSGCRDHLCICAPLAAARQRRARSFRRKRSHSRYGEQAPDRQGRILAAPVKIAGGLGWIGAGRLAPPLLETISTASRRRGDRDGPASPTSTT
jgi:hypothetical protein